MSEARHRLDLDRMGDSMSGDGSTGMANADEVGPSVDVQQIIDQARWLVY